MKRLLLALLLLCGVAIPQAPNYVFQAVTPFSANGNYCGTASQCNTTNTTALFYQIVWSTYGTVSGCALTVDSSPDAITWSTGGIITSQSCTGSGSSSVAAVSANFVRITVSGYAGTGNVRAILSGYHTSPTGAASSPTGDYYNSLSSIGYGNYTTSVGQASRCIIQPLRIPSTLVVSRVSVNVTTNNNESWGVAVYDSTGTTRLLTTGAVVTSTTGISTKTISPVTLQSGWYLQCFAASASTNAYTAVTTNTGWLGAAGAGFANGATTRLGNSGAATAPGAVPPASLTGVTASSLGPLEVVYSND